MTEHRTVPIVPPFTVVAAAVALVAEQVAAPSTSRFVYILQVYFDGDAFVDSVFCLFVCRTKTLLYVKDFVDTSCLCRCIGVDV